MHLRFVRLIRLALVAFVAFCGLSAGANAQSLNLIRDAEIEDVIRDWASPLFRAAGLEPSNIEIYLVKDKSLNAFVAGGQRLFLHTGFLQKTTNPQQVKGVIAHETGHIAGGHLSRSRAAMKKSQKPIILGALLGIGAAIGGRPDVGAAVLAGSQGLGMRNFLAYSRTQEGAADQAAVRLLNSTQQSSVGLVEFLKTIEDQELLSPQRQDPYMRSHPVTADRIDNLNNLITKSPYAAQPESPQDRLRHARMVAKLNAFLDPIGRTLLRYKDDNSLEGRYARAIAYYRQPDLDRALSLIDGLIADNPDDPYFWELKGQMLWENGKLDLSLEPYRKALALKPDSALFHANLAQVELSANDPALLDSAISHLDYALNKEPDIPFYWRQLATAWGRKGDQAMSSLALAEEALLQGKTKEAVFYAERATRLFPEGSPRRLQADDVLNQAQAVAAQNEDK